MRFFKAARKVAQSLSACLVFRSSRNAPITCHTSRTVIVAKVKFHCSSSYSFPCSSVFEQALFCLLFFFLLGEAESEGPVAGTSVHRPVPCQLWGGQTDRWVCSKGVVSWESWLIIESRLSHFQKVTKYTNRLVKKRLQSEIEQESFGKINWITWMEMIAFHCIRFCDLWNKNFHSAELILIF